MNIKGATLKKDLLSVADLNSEEINALISDAVDMKEDGWSNCLDRKILSLLFEKPSLRTRVSFETAMRQLGGHTIYLSPDEVGMGERESVSDVASVLCRYVNIIAARTFSHKTIETLAKHATVPVINALSDLEHPCQALSDLLTIYEKKGGLRGLTLAYVGDGNNVAHSLMLAASLTGINFRIASPPGYSVNEDIMQKARYFSEINGAEILLTQDIIPAVNNADVIYTDVWTSMGQEIEANRRRRIFADYQINKEVMSYARKDAIFMHPLPAHYGEEVSEDIKDSLQSVVFDQAENRLHLQKTLLANMLGGLEMPLAGYR